MHWFVMGYPKKSEISFNLLAIDENIEDGKY